MANTYKWTDILTIVGSRYPKMQADNYGAAMLDRINNDVWNAADWRVSLVEMEPFYVQPLVQDYVAPTVIVPSNFLGLRHAVLVNNLTTPATRFEPPMTVDRYLTRTSMVSRPNAISYEPTVGGFRLHPRPPNGLGPMDWSVESTYKKLPTKVTASTLASTLPFEDLFFSVYLTGLDYLFSKSPTDLALFNTALMHMAETEAVNLGQQTLSPREPLVHWDRSGFW